MSDTAKRDMDLRSLFELTTTFSQNNGKKEAGSYFKVTLSNVSSFRNHILDIRKIEKYLQSVVPVPFNSSNFEYSNDIRSFLSQNVPNFDEFVIKLNGDEIYKPYKNSISTSRKSAEKISGIEFFELRSSDEILAYGWYGRRSKLLGSINPSDGVSGIRVKAGNITIGGERLLDGCFRENRFNGYMIGEIHVISPRLIPNSRRDDFVDNKEKTLFYNAVERDIGLPISREIRLRSRLNSQGMQLKINHNSEEATKTDESNEKCFCKAQSNPDKKTAHAADNLFAACGDCEKIRLIKERLGL